MITEKLRITQLIIVLIIAGQGLFYLLGAAEALKGISTNAFAEQRKAIDTVIAGRLTVLYYIGILLGVAILITLRSNPASPVFILTLFATLLIGADAFVAIKFNVPINNAFKNYPGLTNIDWRALQLEWLKLIVIRGFISITAFIILLLPWLKR